MKNSPVVEAAQKAYLAGIAESPCPLGVGENDAYADSVAYFAARDAGATDDEARVITARLTDTGGWL